MNILYYYDKEDNENMKIKPIQFLVHISVLYMTR